MLSETDQRIQVLFNDNGEEDLMDGAVVSLQLKSAARGSRWVFTKSGHIQSEGRMRFCDLIGTTFFSG